jgi:hypothetical protein
MRKVRLSALALAGTVLSALSATAQFAGAVMEYQSGVLPSALAAYTNAAAALGEPSRVTPGPFGGPVDPFAPAYTEGQLVSLGDGGSLTVFFPAPILNDPAHPFGLDFLVFGNAGFVITNGDFGGGGVTDGSLFGQGTGLSRVLVSADNATWYELDPALGPPVDGLYPTDGSGDFSVAVDPALGSTDFAGKGLTDIRTLYGGSGGGTGFDLAWARDAARVPVMLPSVSYVRVEVMGGHAEIDGFAVVPEPAPWALAWLGATLGGLSFVRRRSKTRQAGRRSYVAP